MPNAFNQRFHVYRCSCGLYKRGTEMKKHRSAKNKCEPNTHDTVWSSLVCSVCHASASFGNESFVAGHSTCEPQESTAKKSFTMWLDDLSQAHAPQPSKPKADLNLAKDTSKASDRQLKADLHLSSDDDEAFEAKVIAPPKAQKATIEAPTAKLQHHEVDLDLEAVFSPEATIDWEVLMKSTEAERAVAAILPPLPAVVIPAPKEGPSTAPLPAEALPEQGPSTAPLPAQVLTEQDALTGPALPDQTKASSQAASKPQPSVLPGLTPSAKAAPTLPPSTPKTAPAPPTPKPRSKKRLNTSPFTVRATKGIKRQSALHDEDAYMAKVTQREAQVALLDRYNSARANIKRLTQEKEVAEEKAAAILSIKEENMRLRTQRGHDVEALAKASAEKTQLHARLDFALSTTRNLEEEVRKLKADNERLRKARAAADERHTLHIPCVSGAIVARPEVNADGAPLSICFDNEERGVTCHHIALHREDGRLVATPLTVQKRKIPDEVIASAKRMCR